MASLGVKFPSAFLGDGEKTFQYQGDLPSLPVPRLRQTLDKYLDSGKVEGFCRLQYIYLCVILSCTNLLPNIIFSLFGICHFSFSMVI